CQRGDAQKPGPVGPTDNGVSALPPNFILDRAKEALQQAKSYRVKGNGVSDGQKLSLDFRISGNDLGGKVTMGGATIELLSVAGRRFMRPDEKFWAMAIGADKADKMVKLIGDRWVVVPDDDKRLVKLFSIANVDQLFRPDSSLKTGETRDIDGVKAIGVVESGAEGGALYVATTGQPYPLLVVGSNPADGEVAFSDFGATFEDLKAPPESDVIDLEEVSRN
ncbi:MAG TPA: hypothetical protein VHN18_17935, partial [Micromonosporaceae bacterium]|nr:hypothetical protein [Micromonosporaceae bacterium]